MHPRWSRGRRSRPAVRSLRPPSPSLCRSADRRLNVVAQGGSPGFPAKKGALPPCPSHRGRRRWSLFPASRAVLSPQRAGPSSAPELSHRPPAGVQRGGSVRVPSWRPNRGLRRSRSRFSRPTRHTSAFSHLELTVSDWESSPLRRPSAGRSSWPRSWARRWACATSPVTSGVCMSEKSSYSPNRQSADPHSRPYPHSCVKVRPLCERISAIRNRQSSMVNRQSSLSRHRPCGQHGGVAWVNSLTRVVGLCQTRQEDEQCCAASQ